MRTTLKIDDDVLIAAKERAAAEGRTAGEVISELARATLNRGANSGERDTGRPASDRIFRNGFPLLPPMEGIVTNEMIDELREQEAI